MTSPNKFIVGVGLLALALTIIRSSVHAQSDQVLAGTDHVHIRQYSTSDGLAQSEIYIVYQDSRGFLWSGSALGLSQYDGKEFTNFRVNPANPYSLNNNWVYAIAEDDSGYLWIGTAGGLDKFDPKTAKFHHIAYDDRDPGKITDDQIRSLYYDDRGFLWIGTLHNGVGKLNLQSGKFQSYTRNEKDRNPITSTVVKVITADRSGHVWIAGNDGLSKYDHRTNKFTNYASTMENFPITLIESLYFSPNNTVWIGTSNSGVYQFNVTEQKFRQFLDISLLNEEKVLSIVEDDQGRIWFSSKRSGLFQYDPTTNSTSNYLYGPNDTKSLNSNDVSSVLQGKFGELWVGTLKGLNKLLPYNPSGILKFRLHHFRGDIGDDEKYNLVRSIIKDKSGIIWYGTNNGLVRYDRDLDEYRIITFDSGAKSEYKDQVACFLEDERGLLWIGTSEGLVRFDPSTERYNVFYRNPKIPGSIISNYVFDLAEDMSGNLIVGTWAGISILPMKDRYSDNPRFINPPEFRGMNAQTVLVDKSNTVWIGDLSDGGLYHWTSPVTADTVIVELYKHEQENLNSLSANDISALEEDNHGNIWVGTLTQGLNRFDQATNSFIRIGIDHGLPHWAITDLIADANDRLWIATASGIGLLDSDPTIDLTGDVTMSNLIKKYSEINGLQGDIFSMGGSFLSADNEIFFGGFNGFNSLSTAEFSVSQYSPEIVITDFRLFNKSIYDLGIDYAELITSLNQTKTVILSHDQNLFTFRFSALDLAVPERIEYAYRMIGFSDNWVHLGNKNEATFTNLDPGDYSFQVQSTNSEGVWTDNGLMIGMTITPPWWETISFRAFMVFLALGVIVVTYYWRTDALRKRKEELEDEVDRRTRELKNAESQLVQSEKMASLGQLTAGIAHEINNPINFVKTGLAALDRDHEDILKILNSYSDLSDSQFDDAAKEEMTTLKSELDFDLLLEEIPNQSKIIAEGADRTIEIVAGLQTFSRLEEGEKKSTDLHKNIDSTLAMLTNRIGEHIIIEKDYGEIPKIECYPGKLNQVFMNLLSNAIDAMKSDGAEQRNLTITTAVESRNGNQFAVVGIQDEGSGIPEDILDKIFDPFFTTKDVGEGVGLGLSISYGIIEEHDGLIEVDSTLGEGTTFRVLIPINEQVSS